jgi:excisionase family DNA binding protein
MPDSQTAPLLLSLDESAALMGIGIVTLHKIIRNGEIGSVKIGKRRLIPRQEIDAFIRDRITRKTTKEQPTT